MTFVTVYFSRNNGSQLDSLNTNALNTLKQEIAGKIGRVVLVYGFASGDGNYAHNMSLSERRRETVLTMLGVSTASQNVGGLAFGEICAEDTETASNVKDLESQRQHNRKVSIITYPGQMVNKNMPIKLYPPIVPKPGTRKPAGVPMGTVPPAPSLGSIMKKNLKLKQLQNMAKPCSGDYCLDIGGSVFESLKLMYKLNAGK